MQGFTYYASLKGVELSEEDNTRWVHALPLGEYQHPIHGTLKFDTGRIERFVESVKRRVMGTDPDIDYDHKMDPARGRKAAGWVKDADARQDGLWLLVEWTKDAVKAIKNKEYRYFSAEYHDEIENNKGDRFTDVVMGGALTNRPFMKNLTPINLSDVMDDDAQHTKENGMDPKKLRELLGLKEDASDADVEAKLAESSQKADPLDLNKAEITVGEDGVVTIKHPDAEGEVTHKLETLPPVTDNSAEDKNKQELEDLAKDNPAVAALLSDFAATQQTVKQLSVAHRLSEVGTQLSDLGKEQNKTLAPVVLNELSQVLVQLPKELSDKVVTAVEKIIGDNGVVQLGEVAPTGTRGGTPDGNDVKKFTDAVQATQEANKDLGYRQAVELTARENPDLYMNYQDAIASGVRLDD